MTHDNSELLSILDKIRDLPIMVAGDIMLDRYIWGKVERISPEAPVPVVQVTKTEDRPGGAGNVARNLAALGARVSLCGFTGDDDEGQGLLKLLDQGHIQKDGVIIERGRETSLKTRVIAHGQQVVRIDRERIGSPSAALCEGFAAMVESQLKDCRAVIISDYGKGAICPPVMKKLQALREAGQVGLGSRPLVVDPHPRNYDLYKGISVAKPNRSEAQLASGVKIVDRASASEAGKVLLKRWEAEMILVTLGEDGLMIVSADGKDDVLLPTAAREVHDVSGAGDTVTAVFTAALATGASARLAGELANISAGIVVSEVGTAAINADRLRQELEKRAK